MLEKSTYTSTEPAATNRMRSLSRKSGMYLRSFCTSTMTWKLPSAATNWLRSCTDLSSAGPERSVCSWANGFFRPGNSPMVLAPSTSATTRPMAATSQNSPRIAPPPGFRITGWGAWVPRGSRSSRGSRRSPISRLRPGPDVTSGYSEVFDSSLSAMLTPGWRRIYLPPTVRGTVKARESISAEGGESRQALADDQLMDLRGPLVREHRLQVGGVAHDRVLGADPVGAEDRAALPGDADRLAHVVELAHADLLGAQLPGVGEAAEVQREQVP